MNALLPIALVLFGAGPDDPAGPAPGDLVAYQTTSKQAGKDPAAQVRLALWCEAHGMSAERMKHLAAAVAQDPANTLARGLLGLVNRGGKWERPEEVSREVKDDPRLKALREEYFQRRARTADKVDDQWKLARWCDENGLKEEAIAHYRAVVRLDPRREAAWKHLGFKKVKGRWIKPEWQQAARREAEEQKAANKHWKPILERIRSGLASRERAHRERAGAEALRVTDPRAVPMVSAVFARGGSGDQKVAVRLLAQIDAPGSSLALTILALRSPDAAVRREAIQILRRRDPRDFAPILIGLLRETIQFEVRPVNGPGSPGELIIKDKYVNIDRRYSPPPIPYVPMMPGDYITYDASGLPVIDRFLGVSSVGIPIPGYNGGELPLGSQAFRNGIAAAQTAIAQDQLKFPSLSQRGLSPNLVGMIQQSARLPVSISIQANKGVSSARLSAGELYQNTEVIPIGEMIQQAQRAAMVAEQQLESDVAFLNSWNTSIREWNQQVLRILSGSTGVDLGKDQPAWRRWAVDLFGYAYSSNPSPEPTTIVEQVPLAYQPQPVLPYVQTNAIGFQIDARHSCFAAGTPVQTLDGRRPIEEIRAGDLVLTQDPTSGELRYRAVVTAFHNPPNSTYRIGIDSGEAVVATGIHRLWKAGHGWTMARDLKPGDVLRTLGGLATVQSVDPDRIQPVFNLEVAEGQSYFVGVSGVLAHDNSTIHPVPEPFDAVGTIEATSGSTASTPAASKAATPSHRRSMLGR